MFGAQDYPLGRDIEAKVKTPIIYAWRAGGNKGQQHPNTHRGSAQVNFVDGTVTTECDESSDYFAFHGALLLLAWMVVAPYGIYQARYYWSTVGFNGSRPGTNDKLIVPGECVCDFQLFLCNPSGMSFCQGYTVLGTKRVCCYSMTE